MSVSLMIRPGETLSRESFMSLPPDPQEPNRGYLAFDGAVSGPSFVTPLSRRANWNHHEGTTRLATGSAAKQFLTSVSMGSLVDFEGSDGDLDANLILNDCDQDNIFVLGIAREYRRLRRSGHGVRKGRIERITNHGGILDVTGGAYPNLGPRSLGRMAVAWICKPYTEFRQEGGVQRADPAEFEAILHEGADRFKRHLELRGWYHWLNTNFEVLHHSEVGDWHMFTEEVANEGRVQAFCSGIERYVIPFRREDGRWQYTIGKLNEGAAKMKDFNIPGFYYHMNKLENCMPGHQWGGSPYIGGSQRPGGSAVEPPEVVVEFNKHIRMQCDCPPEMFFSV